MDFVLGYKSCDAGVSTNWSSSAKDSAFAMHAETLSEKLVNDLIEAGSVAIFRQPQTPWVPCVKTQTQHAVGYSFS